MAKSRKMKRNNRRKSNRRHRGGAQIISPAPVNDDSMLGPSNQNLAQGTDYARIHAEQHGGAHLAFAPVGDTGMLEQSLRASAHLNPIDASVAAASGMSDQSGGGKNMLKKYFTKMRNYFSLKNLKKILKMKSRKQKGGASYQYANQADYAAPGMLLPPAMEARALMEQNPDWKLASDPASFAPTM